MTTTPRRRIAFYSHDTQGLGHIRRNLALAAAMVAAEPRTDVLVLTGAPQATALPLPPNTEIVTVPTVAKDGEGGYAAGTFAMDLSAVLALRSDLITSALVAFAPDVARYVKDASTPLRVTPVPDDTVRSDGRRLPQSFDQAMGLRRDDTALKTQIDAALVKAKPRIDEILKQEGVPVLPVSN